MRRSSEWTRGNNLSSADWSPLPQAASSWVTSCGETAGIGGLHRNLRPFASAADFNISSGGWPLFFLSVAYRSERRKRAPQIQPGLEKENESHSPQTHVHISHFHVVCAYVYLQRSGAKRRRRGRSRTTRKCEIPGNRLEYQERS